MQIHNDEKSCCIGMIKAFGRKYQVPSTKHQAARINHQAWMISVESQCRLAKGIRIRKEEMDAKRIESIKEMLKEDLTGRRYEHTLGVAYTAAALAMSHGVDMEQAYIGGLLHDCAKCYKIEKLEALCANSGIVLSEEDRRSPQIFHAIYAPVLARKKYGIEDEAILSSLRWHTTGCKEMTILQKIVFTADAIEPNRGNAEYVRLARSYAFRDLDRAMEEILQATIDFLNQKQAHIHEKTMECMEWIQVTQNSSERKKNG